MPLYRPGAEGAPAAGGGTMADDAAPSLARVSDDADLLRAVPDAYGEVHDALLDPGSGYPAAEVAAAVGHTPARSAPCSVSLEHLSSRPLAIYERDVKHGSSTVRRKELPTMQPKGIDEF